MNILFTGGGGIYAEYIYRKLNKNVFFADADIKNMHPIIEESKKFKVEKANSEFYIKSIQNILKKLNIDLLVPTVDEELLPIIRQKSNINSEILLPDEKHIILFLDKKKSSDYFSNNNFGPKTEDIDEANLNEKKYIIKPRFGRGSRGIQIINNKEQYFSYLNLYELNNNEIILQEYIEGEEYTVTMVADKNGNLINIYPIVALLKKGSTVNAYGSLNKEVIAFCKSFHDKTKIKNIYNIQMIFNRSSGSHIFEINPRVSTTLSASLFYNNFKFDELLRNKDKLTSDWAQLKLIRKFTSYIF